MDSEEIPTFSSPKEETAYWKELSLKYKQRYCWIFAGWIWFSVTRALFNLFLSKSTPKWVVDILERISAFPAWWEPSVSGTVLPCQELQAMFWARLSKSRALLPSCASLYNKSAALNSILMFYHGRCLWAGCVWLLFPWASCSGITGMRSGWFGACCNLLKCVVAHSPAYTRAPYLLGAQGFLVMQNSQGGCCLV